MNHEVVSGLLNGVTLRLADTRKLIVETRAAMDELSLRPAGELLGRVRQPRDRRRLPD